MFAADFFVRGKKNFSLAYFDHGTGNIHGALPIIQEYASKHGLRVHVGKIQTDKPARESLEEHWRKERYKWLFSLGHDVVTCHHLNDLAETFLLSSMHGAAKFIYSHLYDFHIVGFGSKETKPLSIYRPFLTNPKQSLIDWCVRNGVKWFEDSSNEDVLHPRNRVRHNILPEVLKINPGFLTVIKKKFVESLWYGRADSFQRNRLSQA